MPIILATVVISYCNHKLHHPIFVMVIFKLSFHITKIITTVQHPVRVETQQPNHRFPASIIDTLRTKNQVVLVERQLSHLHTIFLQYIIVLTSHICGLASHGRTLSSYHKALAVAAGQIYAQHIKTQTLHPLSKKVNESFLCAYATTMLPHTRRYTVSWLGAHSCSSASFKSFNELPIAHDMLPAIRCSNRFTTLLCSISGVF